MKKILLAAAILSLGAASASAEYALEKPKFGDNWSIGIDGGAVTPLKGHSFFGNMRGNVGLSLEKKISSAFAIGVDAGWIVNSSNWNHNYPTSKTAFDKQYVGAYGALNLFTLFAPYDTKSHVFDIEIMAGAGWGHDYYNKASGRADENYFATKAGIDFNFHLCKGVTFSLKPGVTWNMTGAPAVAQTTASYNASRATFNFNAGFSFALGKGFTYVQAYDQAEVDALNAQINGLRADLVGAAAALAECEARNLELAGQLDACLNRQPEVVTKTTDQLSTVRYVNFDLGKYNITASQMPNVAAVASYLKNHPDSKVVIKGYASQDGPLEVNIRLANQRAESVKTTLINKYGIAADRIQAEGQGIGHMFEEESWNRVAICTLDQPATTSTTVQK